MGEAAARAWRAYLTPSGREFYCNEWTKVHQFQMYCKVHRRTSSKCKKEGELESCDRWIKWYANQSDQYGVNFHQGMRSAHIFNNIKMEQLLRVLKQEAPNAASGHNDRS